MFLSRIKTCIYNHDKHVPQIDKNMFVFRFKNIKKDVLIRRTKTCMYNHEKHVSRTVQNMLRLHVNRCFKNMFIKY